jgi:hypothetical protein
VAKGYPDNDPHVVPRLRMKEIKGAAGSMFAYS